MFLSRLILLTAALAWLVVALGAYVRLSDAGLGCPDWPGCYGHLAVPSSEAAQHAALSAFPDVPLDTGKAWKEMIHRYAAATLGLLIMCIFLHAWWTQSRSLRLTAALLGLVAFQALLGRWTVTQLLKPAIVGTHLLGGMAILALLVWLGLTQGFGRISSALKQRAALQRRATLALVVVAAQIALGGWTSANYAALVCGDGLTCRGEWLPAMDFVGGFLSGSAATLAAQSAIHWSHRIGAVAVSLTLLTLIVGLLRNGKRPLGVLLALLLLLQLGLGSANVVLGLPLATAVLHNAVAALLLVVLVALNWSVRARMPALRFVGNALPIDGHPLTTSHYHTNHVHRPSRGERAPTHAAHACVAAAESSDTGVVADAG